MIFYSKIISISAALSTVRFVLLQTHWLELLCEKHPHFLFSLFAVINPIFCPSWFSVPKRKNEIGIVDDLQIAFKRCAPAVFIVLRQKLSQFDAVCQRIFSCAGINPSRAAWHDFRNLFWQILPQIFYRQIPWPNDCDFHNYAPDKHILDIFYVCLVHCNILLNIK